jgi:hypothetical protein
MPIARTLAALPQPAGPVQSRWFANGYQQALRDLRDAFERGGEADARDWLVNNLHGGWDAGQRSSADVARGVELVKVALSAAIADGRIDVAAARSWTSLDAAIDAGELDVDRVDVEAPDDLQDGWSEANVNAMETAVITWLRTVDTTSAGSRQHYIDAGFYLAAGELEDDVPAAEGQHLRCGAVHLPTEPCPQPGPTGTATPCTCPLYRGAIGYDPDCRAHGISDEYRARLRELAGARQTARFAGTNSERQSVGDPGHCERCAQAGHVQAHPDLGCGDVGCEQAHADDAHV